MSRKRVATMTLSNDQDQPVDLVHEYYTDAEGAPLQDPRLQCTCQHFDAYSDEDGGSEIHMLRYTQTFTEDGREAGSRLCQACRPSEDVIYQRPYLIGDCA